LPQWFEKMFHQELSVSHVASIEIVGDQKMGF